VSGRQTVIMGGYEYLEHTADVGLRAYGDSLAEALTQGALGLFELTAETAQVKPEVKVPIACRAGDPAALFVELLNELLALRDIRGMFFSAFAITDLHYAADGCVLEGIASGEPMDLKRHGPKVEVKAATYGGLQHVVDPCGRHVVQCILDL
jgi:SHS2 domain-containing protein